MFFFNRSSKESDTSSAAPRLLEQAETEKRIRGAAVDLWLIRKMLAWYLGCDSFTGNPVRETEERHCAKSPQGLRPTYQADAHRTVRIWCTQWPCGTKLVCHLPRPRKSKARHYKQPRHKRSGFCRWDNRQIRQRLSNGFRRRRSSD